MGTRYIEQGLCYKCKKITHDYCDSCFVFICEEHRFFKSPKHGKKTFIFCEECFKKNKKPIDPERRKV
jgi:hypothetical protein